MSKREVKMARATKASKVGDCWICGRGSLWHRVFAFFLKHDYDPLKALTFDEFKRLDNKHRWRNK